jgi:tRNA A-37 threonylcarbamoyl transferase component Bud32
MRRTRQPLPIPTAQLLDAIARTLAVSGADLEIRTIDTNERQTAAHVAVDYRGDELFAKVLLADRFPRLTPQFVLASSADGEEYCNADEQVRLESESARHLRALAHASDGIRVPRVRATSETERVIVWDRVQGTTLEYLLKHGPRADRRDARGRHVGTLLGSFLRTVHEHCAGGTTRIVVTDCTELLAQAEMTSPETVPVLAAAIDRLQRLIADGRDGEMPLTLVHGDLSLSNIVWDENSRSLAVVDFEHSRRDLALFDLAAWIYGVRVCLFWPTISPSVVQEWESAFAKGYANSSDTAARAYRLSELIAIAWVFGYFLSTRLPERELTATGLTRLLRICYRLFVKRHVLASRMDMLTKATLIDVMTTDGLTNRHENTPQFVNS